jgi:ribose 5-phosphate isomerase B
MATSALHTLVFGADHAGFELKERLMQWAQPNYHLEDKGAYGTDSVDYPDFAYPVAERVAGREPEVLGVLVCGSGNGVCMTANKHPRVRAALCWKVELARLARAHNNANVLCLAGRFIAPEDALAMLQAFVETPFEGGRHQRRVAKIADRTEA